MLLLSFVAALVLEQLLSIPSPVGPITCSYKSTYELRVGSVDWQAQGIFGEPETKGTYYKRKGEKAKKCYPRGSDNNIIL